MSFSTLVTLLLALLWGSAVAVELSHEHVCFEPDPVTGSAVKQLCPDQDLRAP